MSAPLRRRGARYFGNVVYWFGGCFNSHHSIGEARRALVADHLEDQASQAAQTVLIRMRLGLTNEVEQVFGGKQRVAIILASNPQSIGILGVALGGRAQALAVYDDDSLLRFTSLEQIALEPLLQPEIGPLDHRLLGSLGFEEGCASVGLDNPRLIDINVDREAKGLQCIAHNGFEAVESFLPSEPAEPCHLVKTALSLLVALVGLLQLCGGLLGGCFQRLDSRGARCPAPTQAAALTARHEPIASGS